MIGPEIESGRYAPSSTDDTAVQLRVTFGDADN